MDCVANICTSVSTCLVSQVPVVNYPKGIQRSFVFWLAERSGTPLLWPLTYLPPSGPVCS